MRVKLDQNINRQLYSSLRNITFVGIEGKLRDMIIKEIRDLNDTN
jgi:hypothetical protein